MSSRKNKTDQPLTRLQEAALRRFADQGFNGASLAQIAGDVGIKTPSIYAHFKGKDELYLSLVEPSVRRELETIERELLAEGESSAVLYGYLQGIGTRFVVEPHMRFLVQAAYLPPLHLHAKVDRHVGKFMKQSGAIMLKAFEGRGGGKLEPVVLAAAYQGIADSLQAEILYGGREDFERRLAALWAVFELAL